MSTNKEKYNSKDLLRDIDWSDKVGTQIVELHVMEDPDNPENTPSAANFMGSYRIKDYTGTDGKIIPVDINLHLKSSPLSVEEGETPKPLFMQMIRRGEPHLFTLDFDSESHKLIYFFLARHQHVYVEGENNPRLTQAMFKLVLRNRQATVQWGKIDKSIEIANIVKAMNVDECRNLMYFLGKTPVYNNKPGTPLTLIEMKVALLGERFDGLVFADRTKFFNYYEAADTEGMITRVTIEKARAHKLLVNENGVWRMDNGTVIVVSGQDELPKYFSENPEMLSYLKSKISRRESDLKELDDSEKVNNLLAPKRMGRPPKQA